MRGNPSVLPKDKSAFYLDFCWGIVTTLRNTQFTDLSTDAKTTHIRQHYDKIVSKLDDEDRAAIATSDILSWFEKNA